MTKILFITSTRLGDAVLSMGLLDHMVKTVDNPQFTVVCGGLPASLFEGMPHLEELIILKKQKYNKHWYELWKQVALTKWDIVVDLRNSIVSRVIFADHKYIHGNQKGHKVEQNAKVMKLSSVPLPVLFLTEAQKKKAEQLIPAGGAVLGIGPTANWIGKTWPAQNFIEVIKSITSENGVLPNARVAVFAAPGEEEMAYEVLNSVPKDRQIDVIAKGTPGEAAAALARCALYIGNDSGLMHCAAAAGIPTFGLFGASYVDIYGPYGPNTSYAHTPESYDELTSFSGYSPKTLKHSLMTSLMVETVLQKLDEFLKKTPLSRG